MNWYEAIAYCNWLSERMGFEKVYTIDEQEVDVDWNKNGFRLPTTAEWEYAARERGKEVRYGNGKEKADPDEMNFDSGHGYNKTKRNSHIWNEEKVPHIKGRGSTTDVHTFAPNALGLYDMSGNVYDWCWDWYDENYYQQFNDHEAPAKNPRGPESSPENLREYRGGSWYNAAIHCRCAYRSRDRSYLSE